MFYHNGNLIEFYNLGNFLNYVFAPYELIDLFSLIPYFFEFIYINSNFNMLKFLRMFRFFKITRFIKYFEGGDLLDKTVTHSYALLGKVVFIVFGLMNIIISIAVYYVE